MLNLLIDTGVDVDNADVVLRRQSLGRTIIVADDVALVVLKRAQQHQLLAGVTAVYPVIVVVDSYAHCRHCELYWPGDASR